MNFTQAMKKAINSELKQLCLHDEVDGALAFSSEAFGNLEVISHKSRDTLVYMTPEEFLGMAADGYSVEKDTRCRSVLEKKAEFDAIPFLTFTHDGEGIAQVIGHEGRHRARLLYQEGISSIPVVLKSHSGGDGMAIRWGSQDDGFDSLKGANQQFPSELKSETGSRTMPMPKSELYETPLNLNAPVNHYRSFKM